MTTQLAEVSFIVNTYGSGTRILTGLYTVYVGALPSFSDEEIKGFLCRYTSV